MPKKNGVGRRLKGLPKLGPEIWVNGNGSKSGREAVTSPVEIGDDPEVQACLRRLERAVRTHPEEAVNWFVLGRFLLDIGDNRRAEAILKQALRRGPDSTA